MRCPYCKANDDKVIDSRASDGGVSIRRRRECLRCQRRYTTYERLEETIRLAVIKRDGSRMPYDRSKMIEGIRHAAYKRPVSSERIEQIADEVEEYLVSNFEREVSSQSIGERIAQVLRRVDQVAYVRFASVYRQFEDVGDFIDEAQDVIERSADDIPGQQSLFESESSGEAKA
ncbi:MAG: transcriptional repressor NrdR [Planctomycetia bacterium]|nr:MAG: transcriptional repressor NrdR [Planctomycetia bacterium]